MMREREGPWKEGSKKERALIHRVDRNWIVLVCADW